MIVGCLGDLIFQVSPDTVMTVSNFVESASTRYAIHQRHNNSAWHCMTRMEWGLLMRICEMQGFIPLGNNNYGKHSSEQFYKAIKTYDDSGKTGRTATGTGPLTWYHDNSPSGTLPAPLAPARTLAASSAGWPRRSTSDWPAVLP